MICDERAQKQVGDMVLVSGQKGAAPTLDEAQPKYWCSTGRLLSFCVSEFRIRVFVRLIFICLMMWKREELPFLFLKSSVRDITYT